MSPWALNRMVRAIAQGAVIGYPTDTIWGLGCHPLIAASVARILQMKHRGPAKGLILLSSHLEYCSDYLATDAEQLASLRRPTVQPTTWLVPASEFCPPWIRGNFPTVAIRITDHPLLQFLCDRLQAPLVSTSANRAGCATVRNAIQMRKQFGDQLDFIVGGFAAGTGRPSEIKSLASGTILRSSN